MRRPPLFHRVYLAAIAIKGVDGVLETLAGLTLALAGSERLYALVLRATAAHLNKNPDSVVVELIRIWFYDLTQKSNFFIVFYLLVHGVLKAGIVASLLWGGGRWIYPLATAVLAGFVIYMSQRLSLHWSGWLLGFALFDLLTLALVVNEWRAAVARGESILP